MKKKKKKKRFPVRNFVKKFLAKFSPSNKNKNIILCRKISIVNVSRCSNLNKIFQPTFFLSHIFCLFLCLSICLSLSLSIYIYIYIHGYPQTDCFVISQLFSLARHTGLLKLGSKST